jgi:hypothetical protein
MSKGKKTITVSLDTAANPPVTVCPRDLVLKERGTFKVRWSRDEYSPEFVFGSLTIDGETFPNPTSDASPGNGGPFKDISVSDDRIQLKDKVDSAASLPYEYEITVKVGDDIYSTGGVEIQLLTKRPTIRNEA